MTDTSGEIVTAFISKWEYECCGEPLDVGAEVDLHLSAWNGPALHSPRGSLVTANVEHHIPMNPRHVRARVVKLWEMRRRRLDPHGDGPIEAVHGSEEFAPIRHMEIWDDHWQPTRRGGHPSGWLVELDLVEELPVDPNLYP